MSKMGKFSSHFFASLTFMDNFISLSFRGVEEALNIQRNLLNIFAVKTFDLFT